MMKDATSSHVDELSILRREAVNFSREMHKLPFSQWKRPASVETISRYNSLREAFARFASEADDGWPPELDARDEDPTGRFACFDILAYVDLILSRLLDGLPSQR